MYYSLYGHSTRVGVLPTVSRSKRQIKNWIIKDLKNQARAYDVNMFFRDCPSCGVELSLQEEAFLQNFILCSALNFL